MAKITVEVCDVCHDKDRPVRTWRVAEPGGRLRNIALCKEHEKPLLALPTDRSAPGGRGRRRVVPREEVEGRK